MAKAKKVKEDNKYIVRLGVIAVIAIIVIVLIVSYFMMR